MKTKLLLAMALMITNHVFADDGEAICRNFSANIEVGWSLEGCTSPFGLCTDGRIKGGGFLNGATTHYTVTGIGPTPQDPTMDGSIAYTGQLVITTRTKGTLTIEDMGLFDKLNGLNSEQSRSISGDGRLAGAYGSAFTAGSATATGFASKIFGTLCRPKH